MGGGGGGEVGGGGVGGGGVGGGGVGGEGIGGGGVEGGGGGGVLGLPPFPPIPRSCCLVGASSKEECPVHSELRHRLPQSGTCCKAVHACTRMTPPARRPLCRHCRQLLDH